MLFRDLVVFLKRLEHECPGYTDESEQFRRVYKELERLTTKHFDNPNRSGFAIIVDGDPELVCRVCGKPKERTTSHCAPREG